jgi:ATPase family associated with various cellular activities (AAA)
MSTVTILRGSYRNVPVRNRTFRMLKDFQVGAKGGFVTVQGDGSDTFPAKAIRIRVEGMRDIVAENSNNLYRNEEELMGLATDDGSVLRIEKPEDPEVYTETDEEAIERIRQRFDILDEMTHGTTSGAVRAMIVSGPPGVGKSFGVEKVLEEAALFDKIAQRKQKFEVVKGAMSAIGLYAKLFKYADEGCVVVFDDCDSVLLDDLSLNILKAALDSSKKRYISWNTDSRLLRSEGIPDRFEFKGAAIFITNIKFEHVRSKKLKDHLDALESRCHYLDLTLDTTRDKILRIKQIVKDGMLDSYDFEEGASEEIVEYMETNVKRLRELSLRTVLKLADLRKMSASSWKKIAEVTVMRKA